MTRMNSDKGLVVRSERIRNTWCLCAITEHSCVITERSCVIVECLCAIVECLCAIVSVCVQVLQGLNSAV